MLHAHYRRYGGVSRMTAEHCILVARQIERMGRERGEPPLIDGADQLMATAKHTANLAELRRLQRGDRSGDENKEFDTVMDAAIHQFFDDFTGSRKYLTAIQHPLAPRLDRLAERHFPTGVGHITAARYETALHRIERLVDTLRGPAADLVAVLDFERKVLAIEEHLPAYRAALDARTRVTAGDVAEVRDAMHLALTRLVNYILWAHGDDDTTRETLMAPIDDQQDRIAAIMRARRAGRREEVDEAAMADEADALNASAGDGDAIDEGAPTQDGPEDAPGDVRDPDETIPPDPDPELPDGMPLRPLDRG